MSGVALGLRVKSMFALVVACALAFLPAAFVGWSFLDGVRNHFGEAYARNFTELNLQKILAPVTRDLALAIRFAGSEVSREFLLEEDDPAKRALFFREAEGYRQDFSSHSYFFVSAASGNYYFNGDGQAQDDRARYVLDPSAEKDAWFFNTMADEAVYNINVNPDVELGTTRVWLNAVVTDGDRRIGLGGTGLDLGGFINAFVTTEEPGVTPIIVDESGSIQAHPDASLIAFGSTAGIRASEADGLNALVSDERGREKVRAAMALAVQSPGAVQVLQVALDGREQLLALAYAPELRWHVMTAVDLNVANVLESGWVKAVLTAVAILALLLVALSGWMVDRMVLQPLRRLRESATQIARGRYDVSLPKAGSDEIGDLSRAFGSMAEQVRKHTENLESQVRERTAELERSNQELEQINQQIRSSIDYASMIQRATLPDRQIVREFGDRHFILWRPRDVVGGDFYVFFQEGARSLIGVVDCAGHGVPGALMTMLARAAIDHAIEREGMTSPAAILRSTDDAMRGMLADFELSQAIATNMDAGLVFIDRDARILRFAGARISLCWSNGEDYGEAPGHRRAIGDRRRGEYADAELEFTQDATYYMATDGLFDQAGGERGFGFGGNRFTELLRSCAHLPMTEQAVAIEEALEQYRGALPQRDDITLLSFRLN